MRRLRVCQLITDLLPAGAERVVYELSKRLDRNRFEVHVVALRGGVVADWLRQAGVRVSVLGVRGKWDVLKVRKLVGLLAAQQTDLLHTHLFHADLAGRPAAHLAAVPHVVHTIHTAEGRFRPWQFAWARFLAGRCDRLICVSRSVRDHHARRSGLPLDRYTVIANGIDAAAFARDEASREGLRRQWGIEPDQILLAYVGRLDWEKGIDVLLAAMSHLAARGNPMNLVIAGDGPKRHIVENYISHGEGGRYCRLLGFTGDVQAVLSAADVFVMPSRWEGWPLALAEAMAAGLPVIATSVAGVQDVVEDGRTAVLVEGENLVALAEAIERLAGDAELRAALGAAGRQRAARDYSINDCVAAHEALYAEICGDMLAG